MGVNGVCTGFIDDGYTIRGRFKAVPMFYPDTEMEIRPMIREEIKPFFRNCEKNADNEPQIVAEMIASRVVEWSLRYKDDQPFAVSSENVRRIHPMLLGRVYEWILGVTPPDEYPDESYDEEKSAKNSVTA